jgi:hypothetical protein
MANVYVNLLCSTCGLQSIPTHRVIVMLAPRGDRHSVKALCNKCKCAIVAPIPFEAFSALVAHCLCRVADVPAEALEDARRPATRLGWDEALDFANALEGQDDLAALAAAGLTVEE